MTKILRKRSRSKSARKQSTSKKPASTLSDEDAADDTIEDTEDDTDNVDLNIGTREEAVRTRSKAREPVSAVAGKRITVPLPCNTAL